MNKIRTLDEKIQKEVAHLKSQMENMKGEMLSFRPADELKAKSEQKKKVIVRRVTCGKILNRHAGAVVQKGAS